MPSDAPTDAPTIDYRQLLEHERRQLQSELAELGFGEGGGLHYDPNFADSSQVTAERGEAEVLGGQLQESLDEVARALGRLEDGSYGRCESAARPSRRPASKPCRPLGSASTTPVGPERPGGLMAYGGYGGGPSRPRRRFQADQRTTIIVVVAAALLLILLRTHKITRFEIIYFCVLIPSIILHEISHGVVALAFGDDTAKRAGRLTLNPVKHVDPVGTLLVPGLLSLSGLGAYGWAKPVPVSTNRLRSPRNHTVVVSLVGPLTNFILAALMGLCYTLVTPQPIREIVHAGGYYPPGLPSQIFFIAGFANIVLGVFNLIHAHRSTARPCSSGSCRRAGSRVLPPPATPHLSPLRPHPGLPQPVVRASSSTSSIGGRACWCEPVPGTLRPTAVSAPGTTLVANPSPRPGPQLDRGRRAAGWARTNAALVVLLLVPFAVFGLPILFGHAVLDGDNWIQNFPLRVLVGRDLDQGMLPLWNPYLFSGTPLLAGFNAGAAYPGTWLMAVLPVFTAWALTFAAVYDLALLGMYLFLRRQGICRAAATFGAATFAFAGYMTAQLVHVDLIQGAASLPWMLLAVHGLTERPNGHTAVGTRAGIRRARGFMALLAVALGLSFVSGGVEAFINGTVLLLIYWAGRLVALGYLRRGQWRALVVPVLTFALGVAGGVVLGAAQWLPGGAFVAQSQRAGSSYDFFTSGSLPDRLVTLLVSPFVIGTHQDAPAFYAGPYNFEEVTGYAGVLALIAAGVLLTRRWRSKPQSRHWHVWYVIMAFGLLSALGNQTYFGRVLYVVPGLNSQRLLNRNLLLVDCAAAVLLAWWSHLLLTERDPTARARRSPVRSRWRPGQRAELIVTCAPLALSALLCFALWVAGPLLDHFLETPFVMDVATRLRLAPLVTGGTLIAGAATWIVLAEARFSTTVLRRLLAGVLVADLVLFNLFVIRPPISEAQAQARGPAAATFQARVGDGRFIIFDPDRLAGDQLLALGQTDLNIFNRLPSAQGYTALTDGRYYQATGAHLQEDLDPTSLAGPVWDELNVTTLLSVPSYFVTPAPGSAASGSDGPDPDGPFAVARGAVHRWYFGGELTLQSWSVPIDRGRGSSAQVGVVDGLGPCSGSPPRTSARPGAPADAPSRCPSRPGNGRRGSDPGDRGVVGRGPDRSYRRDGSGQARRSPAAGRDRAPLGLHRGARGVRRLPQHGCPRVGVARTAERGTHHGRKHRVSRRARVHGRPRHRGACHVGGRARSERVMVPGLAGHVAAPVPGGVAPVGRPARACHRDAGRHPPAGGHPRCGGLPGGVHLRTHLGPGRVARLGDRSRRLAGMGGGRAGRRLATPTARPVRWSAASSSIGDEQSHGPRRPAVGGGCDGMRLGRPECQHGRHRARIVGQGGAPLADRTEEVDERLGEVVLQVAITPVSAGQHGRVLGGGHGQQLQQIGEARFGLGVVADLAVGIGHRPLDLAGDVFVIVEHADRAERGVNRLRHLPLGVLQVHDPGADLGDRGPGTTNPVPYRRLRRMASSRASSRCWRWSSPTGTRSAS